MYDPERYKSPVVLVICETMATVEPVVVLLNSVISVLFVPTKALKEPLVEDTFDTDIDIDGCAVTFALAKGSPVMYIWFPAVSPVVFMSNKDREKFTTLPIFV